MMLRSLACAFAAIVVLAAACSQSPGDGDAAPSGPENAAAAKTAPGGPAPETADATAPQTAARPARQNPPPRPQKKPFAEGMLDAGGMDMDEPAAAQGFELRMAGKTDKAKTLLEMRTLLNGRKNARDLFELARTHFFLGSFNLAYFAISDAVRIESDNPRTLYWHGLIAYSNNVSRYLINHSLDRIVTDEAIASLEKALAIDTDYHEARLMLIDILVRLRPEDGGDPQKALALAEDLEKRDRGWGALARGYALRPGTSWDDVMVLADGVLAEEPENMGALLTKALGLIKARKPDEAELVVSKVYELDENRRALFLELAGGCVLPEHQELGKRTIERFLGIPNLSIPEKAIGYSRMAAAFQAAGDKDSYDTWMKKANRLDPDFWKPALELPADIFLPPEGS